MIRTAIAFFLAAGLALAAASAAADGVTLAGPGVTVNEPLVDRKSVAVGKECRL